MKNLNEIKNQKDLNLKKSFQIQRITDKLNTHYRPGLYDRLISKLKEIRQNDRELDREINGYTFQQLIEAGF